MTDIPDIDPATANAILEHKDAFLELDKAVDEVVVWGERELQAKKELLLKNGGSLEEFQKEAASIQEMVAEKLKAIENKLHDQYQTTS